jgi:hypothetical protein
MKMKNWQLAGLITVILFFPVLFFLSPLLYSTDDAYLLYALAGGFGESPTNLLHYDYVWHPMLGWMIKTLFQLYPGWNWYTSFLILLQAIATTTIISVVLKRLQRSYGVPLAVVLGGFVVFSFLMRLSFTNTSLLLSIAGCAAILDFYQRDKGLFASWPFFLMLLIAGLLRMHTMAFVIALFIPLFWVSFYKKRLFAVPLGLFATGLIILGLNLVHRNYYRQNISAWDSEESFRKDFFYMSNRPRQNNRQVQPIFRDVVERSFLQRVFFYDTNYLPRERLHDISKLIVRQRNFQRSEDSRGLYWLFMESRLYLALLALCFLVFWLEKNYASLKISLIMTAWFFVLIGYLFVFQKITSSLNASGLLSLDFQLVLILPPVIGSKKLRVAFNLGLVLLFAWTLKKLKTLDRSNQEFHKEFVCNMEVLKANPDKLFIASDYNFPIGLSHVWDTPREFPAKNLLYGGLFLTQSYQPTLKRFGVSELMPAIFSRQDIFLIGADFPELESYYQQRWKLAGRLSEPLPGFGCAQVRRLQKQ